DDAIGPERQLIERRRRARHVKNAEAEHRRIAEPEREPGDEANFRNVDAGQAMSRINAVTHRAAAEGAGADIVADRIAGEAGERRDTIGNLVKPDRTQRKQIVEGQTYVADHDEQ